MSVMAELDAQLSAIDHVALCSSDAFAALCGLYDHVREITAKTTISAVERVVCENYISVMTVLRYALQMRDFATFDYPTEASRRLSLAIGRTEILSR